MPQYIYVCVVGNIISLCRLFSTQQNKWKGFQWNSKLHNFDFLSQNKNEQNNPSLFILCNVAAFSVESFRKKRNKGQECVCELVSAVGVFFISFSPFAFVTNKISPLSNCMWSINSSGLSDFVNILPNGFAFLPVALSVFQENNFST